MSKTVLITGASSGFGKLTAMTLAKAGYRVLATMRNTQGKNAAVAQELSQLSNVAVIELDVTDDQSVNEAIRQATLLTETIDVVVNNAAVTGVGVMEAYSTRQQERMFDINYLGVVRVYNAVLPIMRKQGSGLFINITTGASGFTLPYMVPYFASKMAVESLTEGMQEELRPFHIDNVSLQSGVFDTGMSKKEGVQADRQEIIEAYGEKATVPMQKMLSVLLGSLGNGGPDPQLIADSILRIIQLDPGQRPLRYPVDPLAKGMDIKFIEARAAIKKEWAGAYGF